jgi:hypothetical protein
MGGLKLLHTTVETNKILNDAYFDACHGWHALIIKDLQTRQERTKNISVNYLGFLIADLVSDIFKHRLIIDSIKT